MLPIISDINETNKLKNKVYRPMRFRSDERLRVKTKVSKINIICVARPQIAIGIPKSTEYFEAVTVSQLKV